MACAQDDPAIPRGSRGFTILEVIVVVAILAIVASIAIPTVDLLQTRARSDATVEEMTTLKTGLEAHFEEHLRFPSLVESLETLGYVASAFAAGDAFLDGWGSSYVYAAAGDSATLTSLGADALASANDIQLVVDGTRFLVSCTRDEMETIHVALRNYEMLRVSSALPNLPAVWYTANPATCALGILITQGYLPADTRFRSDAWGISYSYSGTPADYVSSTFGAGGGGGIGL